MRPERAFGLAALAAELERALILVAAEDFGSVKSIETRCAALIAGLGSAPGGAASPRESELLGSVQRLYSRLIAALDAARLETAREILALRSEHASLDAYRGARRSGPVGLLA